MYWEVIVPGDEDGGLSASLTVEADNWFSALRNGLSRQGHGPQLVSNLTCDVKPDKSVLVTDFVTRKAYTLRPLGDKPPAPKPVLEQVPVAAQPIQAPAAAVVPFAKSPSVIPTTVPHTTHHRGDKQGIVEHDQFFSRDEAPDDGSGIFYRERLLSVATDTDKDAAAALAMAYFNQLKAMGGPQGAKLFITVQVFDHRFESRSQRPAIAALSWKEWSPKKAKLQFPLSGEEGIRLSRVPQAHVMVPMQADPVPEPVQVAPVPEPVQAAPVPEPVRATPRVIPDPVGAAAILSELISDTASGSGSNRQPEPVPLVLRAAPSPEPVPQPVAAPAAVSPAHTEPVVEAIPLVATPPVVAPVPEPAPAPLPLTPKVVARPQEREREIDVDDAIVRAFERMQEIYAVRDHDRAAVFALDLSREFIRCEAGSAMLITPGKYELYVAAAQGDVADKIMGKKLSLTKGIVGFASRAGAVITVSDPENDPRFHDEFDKLNGFSTRNIVCAPIQHEGKTIGAIELINSPRAQGFLQTEANVLSYIAGAVGEYIDTSLPSREADFSDKDFQEFLPRKKTQGKRRPAASQASKVAGARAPHATSEAGASTHKAIKQTLAGTPTAKKAADSAGTQSQATAAKKKKKKRKR